MISSLDIYLKNVSFQSLMIPVEYDVLMDDVEPIFALAILVTVAHLAKVELIVDIYL